jgi:hypothetical protein
MAHKTNDQRSNSIRFVVSVSYYRFHDAPSPPSHGNCRWIYYKVYYFLIFINYNYLLSVTFKRKGITI